MNNLIEKPINSALKGQWLTSRQLAEYLGISIEAVHMMVHRKKIPHYRLQGRLRFRRSEIDRQLLASKKGGHYVD